MAAVWFFAIAGAGLWLFLLSHFVAEAWSWYYTAWGVTGSAFLAWQILRFLRRRKVWWHYADERLALVGFVATLGIFGLRWINGVFIVRGSIIAGLFLFSAFVWALAYMALDGLRRDTRPVAIDLRRAIGACGILVLTLALVRIGTEGCLLPIRIAKLQSMDPAVYGLISVSAAYAFGGTALAILAWYKAVTTVWRQHISTQ